MSPNRNPKFKFESLTVETILYSYLLRPLCQKLPLRADTHACERDKEKKREKRKKERQRTRITSDFSCF